MNLGKLRRYRAAKRMSEVGNARRPDLQGGNQVIVRSLCVELGVRVRGRTAQEHVAAILGKKDSVVCAPFNLACPFQLPHGEIGIAMKAKQNAGRGSRISDDESNQLLSIGSLVIHLPGFDHSPIKMRRLKQNSLLRPPEEEDEAE